MRILLLHHFFCPPGGHGNNRSYEFAKIWSEAGNDVFVLTSSAYVPPKKYPLHKTFLLQKKLHVHILKTSYRQSDNPLKKSLHYYFYSRKLKKFALSFRPDIIYAIAPPLETLFVGRHIAENLQVPLYMELMDLWPEVPYYMNILPEFLYKYYRKKMLRLYQKTEKVFLLSPDYLELFKEHYSSVKEKGILSYNGTDTNIFFPQKQKEYSQLRAIYAGALGKANGFFNVLHSVNSVKKQLGNFKLDIYGWGKDLAKARNYVAKNGLSDKISFYEPIAKEELAKKMRQYHIGISSFANFPILQANSANKFYDYLASGLAVLLNYEGWQADFLRKYHAGFPAPQGDNKSFVRNLLTLQNNTELLKKMSQNAGNLANKYFDRKQIARKTLDLFVS